MLLCSKPGTLRNDAFVLPALRADLDLRTPRVYDRGVYWPAEEPPKILTALLDRHRPPRRSFGLPQQ